MSSSFGVLTAFNCSSPIMWRTDADFIISVVDPSTRRDKSTFANVVVLYNGCCIRAGAHGKTAVTFAKGRAGIPGRIQ